MSNLILITGCPSGIGRQAAEPLARCGYRVLAAARRGKVPAALEQTGVETAALEPADPVSVEAAAEMALTTNRERWKPDRCSSRTPPVGHLPPFPG